MPCISRERLFHLYRIPTGLRECGRARPAACKSWFCWLYYACNWIFIIYLGWKKDANYAKYTRTHHECSNGRPQTSWPRLNSPVTSRYFSSRKTSPAEFPPCDAIRQGFSYRFYPLKSAISVPLSSVSGNGCFPTCRATPSISRNGGS
jgi:hypothetical protein